MTRRGGHVSRGSRKSHPLFEGSSWPTVVHPRCPARCPGCTAPVRRLDLILRTRGPLRSNNASRCAADGNGRSRSRPVGTLNAESVDGGSAHGGGGLAAFGAASGQPTSGEPGARPGGLTAFRRPLTPIPVTPISTSDRTDVPQSALRVAVENWTVIDLGDETSGCYSR
jgi:hypothetical protein